MTIAKNGTIAINFNSTGLVVIQNDDKTQVFKLDTVDGVDTEEAVKMPHPRYSLSHDKPTSGVAGRVQFESDIRAYLKANSGAVKK
jgi:hypothetical protein